MILQGWNASANPSLFDIVGIDVESTTIYVHVRVKEEVFFDTNIVTVYYIVLLP